MATIRLEGFPLEKGHREGMRRIRREMSLMGMEIIREAVKWLRENNTNVDGDLRKSITHEVRRFADGVLKLIVGPTVRHGKWVHEGTRPHWPPQEPIRRWVRRKLGITDAMQVRQVAFLVARKISREGTEAQPFLDDPLEKMQRQFATRLIRAYLE